MSGGDTSGNNIILMIVSVISSFSLFFYVIIFVGVVFHYFNLVEQKEAPGLLEKIQSI
jgi:hypothetical protein